ncbi:zinc finger protein 827-like isoform X2 [Sphaeramia orbicularis]|uniref:zinc finger protein 827-like isoform X2 n=1 Tax=Sphaeramia orbicularis TaxID=375764 RepID=UPI00117E0F7B|nr:zinc finger protein 827-like isoform X2 [Sphaeramia orbicularis]
MKRGSSVLHPPSVAAKRHTHPANAHTHTSHEDAAAGCLSGVPGTRSEHTLDVRAAACSSPFPAATSLFSPDVSTKMASDLLIRLSEATQKAQMHPGSRAEAEPQRQEARGGQQDEPGLALSPDGPGASPEPPSLSHTPDSTVATDTLASELLRKLAERQEVNSHVVRVKEEEEPMEVDTLAPSNLIHNGSTGEKMAPLSHTLVSRHLFNVSTDDKSTGGRQTPELFQPGVQMVDRRLLGLKIEDKLYGSTRVDGGVSGANRGNKFDLKVKKENSCVTGAKMMEHLLSGAKAEDQFVFTVNPAEQPFTGAKINNKFVCESEGHIVSGAQTEKQLKTEEQLCFGTKMEEQFTSGAKMADQCLRAVLWQDMSVNLASTLLHQLSERVSKSNSQLVQRTMTPVRSSPLLGVNVDQSCSSPPLNSLTPPPASEIQSGLSTDQTTGCSYFYRCHVCGFETEGRGLFQSHMTEHRQWERGSFSLHCCTCDHLTNQEPEMTAHIDTHIQGDRALLGEMRCPVTPPATVTAGSAPAVAMATQPEKSTSEHRCRICQRSFPGQQELLVHFQGHRQGNQYRCDRCGHLTRTANKLVEHVRVHTGERPFTCSLCPYSAKRRDSLRLHCKVKHPAHVHGNATDTPTDVHTHRSYMHGDNQRVHKHGTVQRLHTNTHTAAAPPSSSSSSLPLLHPSLCDRVGWRDLSPLLPITTLISLKPRSPSTSSSSSSLSSSSKHSFLGYLGLTTSF